MFPQAILDFINELLNDFQAERSTEFESAECSPGRTAEIARLHFGEVNDTDSLKGLSQPELKEETRAVLVEVKEAAGVEDGGPIAMMELVYRQLVFAVHGGVYSRCRTNRPLNRDFPIPLVGRTDLDDRKISAQN